MFKFHGLIIFALNNWLQTDDSVLRGRLYEVHAYYCLLRWRRGLVQKNQNIRSVSYWRRRKRLRRRNVKRYLNRIGYLPVGGRKRGGFGFFSFLLSLIFGWIA